VRQAQLFFPVRALFIPHMVNSLQKLGLSGSASGESRILSVDVLQVMFEWDQTANKVAQETPSGLETSEANKLPLSFRESMVSYLVRLATAPHDPQANALLIRRALTLLRRMVGPSGWTDVTVKLPYFSRALEQVSGPKFRIFFPVVIYIL
jgi:transformation/transcription domain-associated protein